MNPLESSALGLSELLEKRFTLGDKASSILPPKGGTMNYPALATLSGCVLLLASAAAQTKPASWTTPSASEINAVYPEVESLYFDFHRTPELAMHEQQTAAKLADRVKAMGYGWSVPVSCQRAFSCFFTRLGGVIII